ncbi:MAG: ABC transporter ATP-binding protein [Actinomycetota bacterium]
MLAENHEFGTPTHGQGSDGAICIRSLTKSYATKTGPVRAVENISFDVEAGRCHSLVGPSGCGKSTVLKIVAGLTEYDAGEVLVLGQPAREGRRDVGLMFQTPVLLPWRTVLKNVLLPVEIFGESVKEGRSRAERLLELVGLDGFANKYPWELSGGMQQRAALSRVLVMEPDLLLMDEPLAALDEFTRERLVFEISGLQERLKKTVLYVTHDIQEALILSDRVVVMTSHPGEIAGAVDVDLPRPRVPDLISSPEFAHHIGKVRALLRDST